MTKKISLEVLILNDLLCTDIIDKKIYNEAVQKLNTLHGTAVSKNRKTILEST